jgi:cell division protein FtsN
MTPSRTTAIVLAAAAAAFPLAGCGKDKPKIPRSDARSLVALLRTVQRQADAHACTTVKSTLSSLESRVETLPAKTDPDIRSSLRDGLSNLRELVASDCTQVKPKPKETTSDTTSEPTTTPPTETQPTTTEKTTNTDTTTTQTTPTQTTPTETTPQTTPSGGTPPGQQKKGKGK